MEVRKGSSELREPARKEIVFRIRADDDPPDHFILRVEPKLTVPGPEEMIFSRQGAAKVKVPKFTRTLTFDDLLDPQGVGLPGWGSNLEGTSQKSKMLLMVRMEEDRPPMGE
jgi:hypothetical protein